jgi:hypothetical protein
MSRKVSIILVGCLCLIGLVVGARAALKYEATPGAVAAAPLAWPQHDDSIASVQRPKLVMFLHPRCPCSRASLAELAALMAECGEHVDAEASFVRPAEFSAGWEETDLWRAAKSIPGVKVDVDAGGHQAVRFGTATSGTVLLYDREGRLLFNGGITGSRGHVGPNAARALLTAMLLHSEDHQTRQTPVYGCPLFDVAPSSGGGPACPR